MCRHSRIAYLESLLNTSSSDLVTMASQLSEAEERDRTCSGRARWQHLRSMGDAKTLLHLMFNVASYSRFATILVIRIQISSSLCLLDLASLPCMRILILYQISFQSLSNKDTASSGFVDL